MWLYFSVYLNGRAREIASEQGLQELRRDDRSGEEGAIHEAESRY
jgi:hypothetical protein